MFIVGKLIFYVLEVVSSMLLFYKINGGVSSIFLVRKLILLMLEAVSSVY